MNRRDFLRATAVAPAVLWAGAKSLPGQSAAGSIGTDARWRNYEIITRVEVLRPSGRTRVWLPTPLVDTPYQRTLGDTYRADGGFVEMVERPNDALDMLVAEWPDGIAPILKLTSRVTTRDHAVNLAQPTVPPQDLNVLAPFLRATKSIPTNGIVKRTADSITRDAGTDLERARAIYEWVVDNTFRDPKVRGCGLGDIRFMLESGSFGGKCADLNALFVGLARAAGIPARSVFGLRLGPSHLGYASLGVASETATQAQHCRAEVYLTGYGWTPVDPADVRKVVLDEPPGNLPMAHEKVRAARTRLFGSWEMNWVAFNYAHDLTLPGATRGPIGYFMYPQAETANSRIDSLDPEAFRYDITVRESA